MRVLICGSRTWTDGDIIRERLRTLPVDATIIHGAARGADEMAGRIAEEMGFVVESYPADWDKYGKRAGLLRNLQMLDSKPDVVIAFQVGKSRGTQHTIDNARKRQIPTEVYYSWAR